jgi:hypothetical protein
MFWSVFSWGQGSALGLLAVLGYVVFAAGAILLWFNRPDVPVWVHDELGAIRRNLIRHAVYRPGRGLRAEVACKEFPSGFCRCLARASRRKVNRGAILLAAGPLLFLLDYLL